MQHATSAQPDWLASWGLEDLSALCNLEQAGLCSCPSSTSHSQVSEFGHIFCYGDQKVLFSSKIVSREQGRDEKSIHLSYGEAFGQGPGEKKRSFFSSLHSVWSRPLICTAWSQPHQTVKRTSKIDSVYWRTKEWKQMQGFVNGRKWSADGLRNHCESWQALS